MNAFLLSLGRKERCGGAAQGPLGCAASHTRAVPKHVTEAVVMWAGSGMVVGTCQASTPSLMQRWSRGPSRFPQGWYSACPLSRWGCAARHCPVPIAPWAVPAPSLGIPALLALVGQQRMCPPGDGTSLHSCCAQPKAAVLEPDGGLHVPTWLASALASSCVDGKCKFNMFSFSDSKLKILFCSLLSYGRTLRCAPHHCCAPHREPLGNSNLAAEGISPITHPHPLLGCSRYPFQLHSTDSTNQAQSLPGHGISHPGHLSLTKKPAPLPSQVPPGWPHSLAKLLHAYTHMHMHMGGCKAHNFAHKTVPFVFSKNTVSYLS